VLSSCWWGDDQILRATWHPGLSLGRHN